jgi:cytochrome c biogenesis protein
MSPLKETYRLLRFVSSMKTGLALLLVVGILAAIGSGVSPDRYYQAWPFQFCLGLLLLNMAFCTAGQVTRFFRRRFQSARSAKGLSVLLRQLGVLALHAGVVLILTGGALYSFQGQSSEIKIDQGASVDVKTVFSQAKSFDIKLDGFNVEYNPDGSAAQYFSHVSLVDQGKVAEKKDISVNNPLEYDGIKAYQSAFGYAVELQGEGAAWQKTLEESQSSEIPGTDKSIKIYKYIPNFDPQYGMESKTLRPDNPLVIYSLYQKDALLDVGSASFGEKIEIQPGTYVAFNGVKPYTVLTVKRDPGLSLVLAGGVMLMLGTCLALFLKPKKTGDEI